MIELGDFQPTGETDTLRAEDRTIPARLTTTEEQKREAITHILDRMAEGHARTGDEGRCRVLWTRGAPTFLLVTCAVEHLAGRRVWVAEAVTEQAENGASIVTSSLANFRRMKTEVEDLAEKGML